MSSSMYAAIDKTGIPKVTRRLRTYTRTVLQTLDLCSNSYIADRPKSPDDSSQYYNAGRAMASPS